MLSLQEIIHKFEVGEGARHIIVAALLLGLCALTATYDVLEFKNFSTQEAMDSAQLARNIAEGRGYTTQFIRPFSLMLLQRQSTPGVPLLNHDHPDLTNPPVYPLILAGLMKVLPFDFQTKPPGFSPYQPEVLIAFFNQLLFFVTIFLVFRLARRLFDSAVAWLSTIIFAATELFWKFSISGLSTILLLIIFLLIALCLVVMEQHDREQQRGGVWFGLMGSLVGLLTGVGGLTRYSFAWLVLPMIGFYGLYFGKRRWLLIGSTLAACALVMVPWLLRNHSLSGAWFGTSGYALYEGTAPFPENRLERFLNSDFNIELATISPRDIAKKFIVNASKIVREDLPRLGGNWVAGLFLVSLLVPFRNPALARLRVFTVLASVTLVVVQSLGHSHLSTDSPEINSENLLVLVSPLVFVFGTGMFLLMLDQIEFPLPALRTMAAASFAVLVSIPLISVLAPPRSSPVAWPPYWPLRIQTVSSYMRRSELMMSDMPWAVAWYGDRKCIWTTLDAPGEGTRSGGADFFAIFDYQKPISGLYLTQLTSNTAIFSGVQKSPAVAWGDFMMSSIFKKSIPTGFPLKYATPHFIEDGQLFLSDRERWAAK